MPALDLTPFGFTPTENLAYRALMELGASTGYAVARQLSIARANAYQALDGLVTKGAASLQGTQPRVYRGTLPAALFARILDSQARRLDLLEQQVAAQPAAGEPKAIELAGLRAVRDLATRLIVRVQTPILCLAPRSEIDALVPALRARAAAGRETDLWAVGNPTGLTIPVSGALDQPLTEAATGGSPLLLLADGALAALLRPERAGGVWSADPLMVGLVRAAISGLTGRSMSY